MFEDNDAVIRMISKGCRTNVRHVPRTHRVDLFWLFSELILDRSISIRYVRTTEQLADMLIKGAFTAGQWKSLMWAFDIQATT